MQYSLVNISFNPNDVKGMERDHQGWQDFSLCTSLFFLKFNWCSVLLEFCSAVETRVSIYHCQVTLDEVSEQCVDKTQTAFFFFSFFFFLVNSRFNLRLKVVQKSNIVCEVWALLVKITRHPQGFSKATTAETTTYKHNNNVNKQENSTRIYSVHYS